MAEYIWHETIQTQHTRRSFRSEVAPDVIATVRGWIDQGEFPLPSPDGGDYRCRVIRRSAHCIMAEVLGNGVRLITFGVADHARCGEPLWQALGGANGQRPQEPWCVASLDPAGLLSDAAAFHWLGDFERCFAWAFLEARNDNR